MAALRQLVRQLRPITGLGYARPAPLRPMQLLPALGFRTFFTGGASKASEVNAAVRQHQQHPGFGETARPRRYTREQAGIWELIFTDKRYNRLFMCTLVMFSIVMPWSFMVRKIVDQSNSAAAGNNSPPVPVPS